MTIDSPLTRSHEVLAKLFAMSETCALDVADDGESNIKEVADLLDLTPDRVRIIEMNAIKRLRIKHELADKTED